MRRCLLLCIICTLIFMLVLTSCSGPHLEISVKWVPSSTTLPNSSDLTVSIPDTADAMLCENVEIPATVSNGVSPFTFEWRYKRQSDSNWNSYSNYNQTFTRSFIDTDTWVCYCIVTDRDSKRAQSNICTINVNQSTNMTVSIPLELSEKTGRYLNIPVTVSGGTASYTYRWYYKTTSDNGWQHFIATPDEVLVFDPRFYIGKVNTCVCYCIVVDKDGNAAKSNECTITIIE